MSRLTYRRPVLVVLALLVLVTGCGSAAPESAPTSTATVTPSSSSTASAADRLDGCAPPTARVIRLPEPNMPALPVLQLGSGPRAVVLLNQSDLDLCGWLPFARRLVRAGYRAVLFDERSPLADTTAVVRYLRAHGARSVALVGASQGAKVAIVAGAGKRTRVDAVVSLSAESVLTGTGAVLPYARRLRAPTLFATADQDPYDANVAGREFAHAAKAHHRLLVVRGAAHGIALLDSGVVTAAVLDWLARYAR